MSRNPIQPPTRGGPIRAEWGEEITRAANRGVEGVGVSDESGLVGIRRPYIDPGPYWAVLDEELSVGSYANATLKVRDVNGDYVTAFSYPFKVYAPPPDIMTSAKPADEWVQIEYVREDGKWYVRITGSSNDAFSFQLRSTLGQGGTAIAEKTIIRASGTCEGGYGYYGGTKKLLCTRSTREFCRVIDRLGEFTGTKNIHCGIGWRLSDTWATWEEYCLDNDGRPTDADDADMPADAVWDAVPYEINRMVCGNFLGCRCAAGPCGDCDEEGGS